MYECGANGSFQYANSDDNDDTLCNKIQNIFNVAQQTGNLQINVRITNTNMMSNAGMISNTDMMFPVDYRGSGTISFWIERITNNPSESPIEIFINDQQISNNIIENPHIINKYILMNTDKITKELCKIDPKSPNKLFKLHLLKYILNIFDKLSTDDSVQQNIHQINEQIHRAIQELPIDMNLLADKCFTSVFGFNKTITQQNKPKPKPAQQQQIYSPTPLLQITEEKSIRHKYSRNPTNSNRNTQQKIVLISKSPNPNININNIDDITYLDNDGNNLLHIVCYCGCYGALDQILKKYNKHININQTNNDGESCLTIAIKTRGFYKCVDILLKYGAYISTPEQTKSLQ